MPAELKQEAIAWLARLRAGDPSDQQAFENWFVADPAHAHAYEAVLASWEESAGVEIASGTANPARARGGRHAMAALAAGIALMVAGLGWFAVQRASRPSSSAATMVAIASPSNAVRRVALDDGTRLTLDRGSAVVADYSTGRRRIRLDHGVVRFAVASDPSRPFTVETVVGTITATGTAFDVAVSSARASVTLWSGSLDILCSNTVAPVRMVAGTRLTFTKDGALGEPSRVSGAAGTPPVLAFDNAPLGEVLAALSRADKRPIMADPDTSRSLRFTGTLRLGDPAAAARLLAATFRLQLRQDRGGRLLLSR